MIKEIVQFTEIIPEDVKKSGILPREGIHIQLNLAEREAEVFIDPDSFQFELYNKPKANGKAELSLFLETCAMRSEHSWCIDTNKCFDLPTKAIHSCSPYCVAFKREHLIGGEKYKKNESDKKKQLYDRFATYFSKASELFDNESDKQRLKIFESFFTYKTFESVLQSIDTRNKEISDQLNLKIEVLKSSFAQENDKFRKDTIKEEIKEIEEERVKYRELSDSDYIIFYLNINLEQYQEVHNRYLKDKLFNKAEYNTEPDENGLIYGTSNFFNGFNEDKPFLMHQTATFDITSRISDKDARELFLFEKIIGRGFISNPLPIFIYKEELKQEMIQVFRRNIKQGERIGYKKIIEELWDKYKEDLGDYYLLFYQNTKDGIVFNDFDFVSKFDFELIDSRNDHPYWKIFNLFELREKKGEDGKGADKFYPKIHNLFDLEQALFGAVLSNKYKRFDYYFKDLDGKDFEQLDSTLVVAYKYRKAIYDYIYKSKKQAIGAYALKDIMTSAIRDDLKHGREYGIKDKLNIWFSLNHHFDENNTNFNTYYMPDKLDQLMKKTMEIADSKERVAIEDEYEFAFIAGQIIRYLLGKSGSADNSHILLEAFLQKTNAELFKKEICKYFARYKHAVEKDHNERFHRLMREVAGFDKEVNIQDVLTFMLAGYFSNSFYYIKKESESES